MITEVTPVNERILRLRISHILGVIFLVSLYAPTGVIELSVTEAYYAQLQMVVNSCHQKLLWSCWVISMQPLALTKMAISHVLVLTALDKEMKAPQCSLTLQKVGD